ncbi:AARP2CN domain-containing protein [Colletotrichum higginsianum IMI 349063]|uniref:AARP2CN domain-containing protein n=2 Tax=Colletotrichum higginsianum TaxID=80884 RepID=A0A1B7Y1U8_COLHI|nr:AARP2CN domain-containing protein [Colletotrichum higginsianum IMI 349063]OBR05995.1 AARP2CN domain-containing protein [Colletotrichum higginsianum IMI 349063]TIC96968.1 Ribosome biogenesis protein tsr1 [Colletotrichum higginsianum]
MSHSHRPTTKVTHKPFKSKHATKGALRDAAKGRLPGEERGQRKTPHQQVMSKFDRRNQAKQRQITKRKERLEEASIFVGRDGAPRIVAVVPLCQDGDAAAAIKQLNDSVDIEAEVEETPFQVSVDRFKQKVQYIPLKRDLNAVLDATRVADFVLVMLSADVEVDELGELMLRGLESQGLSTLFTVVYGLDKIDQAKHKQSTLGSLKSYITHFHPEQEKLYQLENRQECANLMRSLCNTTPKGVRWREDRSWVLAEDVKFSSSGLGSTVITGVVRGRGLKANRLIQLGDYGTFQVEKITAAPLPKKLKRGEMAVEESETEEILDTPDEDQDDLAELAPDAAMDDDEMEADGPPEIKKGVLLDDHHYFDDDYYEAAEAKTRVPKGTSNYQAAWYLGDDVSDSGSDMEDLEMQDNSEEDEARPEDGLEGQAPREPTEGAPSEYAKSEKFVEPDEEEDAAGLAAYRARKSDEVEDDKEFPDEIELHPGVLARERLQRYRGLKSLRTSEWIKSEDRAYEPEAWRKLLQIPDYQASRSRTTREALVGGVPAGTRVHVHLKGVPASFEKSYQPSRPVTLFSLLRHEQKKTAVNYLINLSADYHRSVKAKEEIIVQCGPRRFAINPIFSQPGNTPNNVHKSCRYLHPGQSAVATFMGPVTWGAVPVLFFKRSVPVPEGSEEAENESTIGLKLIGTGTALPPSTSRVIAKRVILTGHPYHIHKKIVTIRYMFFNREDVEWFKALPLWTKRGRTGFIKEPLGTHGYFKATFDARINPQDSIGVSLYKRVWPRNAVPVQGPLLEPGVASQVDEGDVMME